ncbi:hypothetical protein Q9966_008746 [Columba livia]|nr:hypothetical protein Q9966_008746 [Columba livia]
MKPSGLCEQKATRLAVEELLPKSQAQNELLRYQTFIKMEQMPNIIKFSLTKFLAEERQKTTSKSNGVIQSKQGQTEMKWDIQNQAHHRHDISARPSALGKWQLLEAKYHVVVLSLRVYDKHFDFLEPKGLQQSNMGNSLIWHAGVINHSLTVINSYKSSNYKTESMEILRDMKFAVT